MEEVIAIAHQPEDMIKFCEFGSQAMYPPHCTELIQGSFKMFSPTYGVCYGFNYKSPDRTTLYTTYGGGEFGLKVVLDIEG